MFLGIFIIRYLLYSDNCMCQILSFLFSAGIHGEIVYTRPGENAFLPCVGRSFSDPTCSNVAWVFNRDATLPDVGIDFVSRSLDSNCSLVVKNVSAEDVGLYKCGGSEEVYLNLLTSESFLSAVFHHIHLWSWFWLSEWIHLNLSGSCSRATVPLSGCLALVLNSCLPRLINV